MGALRFWFIFSMFVILTGLIMTFAGKSIRMPLWKRLTILAFALVAGYYGAKFMVWVENGDTSGLSFYGTHFLSPLGALIVALILRTSLDDFLQWLDLGAACLCACQFVLKVNCYIAGCCYGRVLWTAADGTLVRFPSQIAESLLSLAMMFFMLYLFRKGKFRNILMWVYYILYGVVRFLMNLLRETTPFVGPFSAGCFWSLISIAVGFFFIYVHYLRTQANNSKHKVIHSHSGRR